jgi:hypothetical protein
LGRISSIFGRSWRKYVSYWVMTADPAIIR